MANSKNISVVVTCYNYASYLAGAIDSILAQTSPVGEIIVVNDGSTDHTDEVMKLYSRHPAIKYIKQENKGQAAAKNRGIRESRGKFIAFLDADDMWEKTKIEKQLPKFDDPKVGVVYSRQLVIDAQNEVAEKQPQIFDVHRGWITRSLLLDNFIPFSSVIIRRECIQKMGLFNESYAMAIDWDLWLRYSLETKFDYVNEPLHLYRQNHPGQMSGDRDTRLKCSDKIFSEFIREYSMRLSPHDIRRAKVYTYNSRGYAFRGVSMSKSFNYYVKSFMENPFQTKAYIGMFMAPLGIGPK